MGKKSALFITSYPIKGQTHSKATVGVASYSKQIVDGLVGLEPQLQLVVLAEEIRGESDYVQGNVEVKRIWRRGSLISLVRLFGHVASRDEKTVFCALEINMFGGILHAAFFLLLLAILKLFGKKIVLIVHQVPGLGAEIGLKGIGRVLQRIMIRIYYFLIKHAGSEIVVFEEYLRLLLGGGRSIHVIPHLIPRISRISKKRARKELGWDNNKLYVMVFGYISPYKGIDRALSHWSSLANKILVIAGGINPNHANDVTINKYVDRVNKLAKSKSALITGFVPENIMPLYFSACDVLMLPYTTMFSSSGPLAMAVAYMKPFILSSELSGYVKTRDFGTAMESVGLSVEQVFDPIDDSIVKKCEESLKLGNKFEAFSKELNKSRNLNMVAKSYMELMKDNK